jgi:hypothetical protein
MGLFGSTESYSYEAILSFSCDPSNIVHDFHGTIDVKGRATRDKVLDQVVEEYVEANRHLRNADVQVLSFDYR